MATPIKNKYFILRTRQRTSISSDGGEYLLAIDNIQTILGGAFISVVYAGGIVVKLMFTNLDGTVANLDTHKEGVISYMTNSAIRLLESPNVSFKIPYKFPGAVSTAGDQMYINEVQLCQFTTGC